MCPALIKSWTKPQVIPLKTSKRKCEYIPQFHYSKLIIAASVASSYTETLTIHQQGL